jgi:hypothetical protein
MLSVRKVRESIAIGLMCILIGFAFYSLLGLAWTFKTAVEATEKIRHKM